MYDEHFGLTARPFQLTPDPAFWYETATHRRAMAYLGYGLAQGEGFIVVTGDIGAGKTTLMRHLVDTIDRDALNPITIVSTAIDPSDLLRIVAQGLGADPGGRPKAELLVAIERGLHAVARTGRRTLLIVDEAQALPTASLEELRMFSNFQAGGHALLQIVLLGQPEFREAMAGAKALEQLRQRVIAIHHLEPMAADEVAPYVRHRLSVAGWTGRPGFADSGFAALHRYSDGVPRRLNQLANRVMLHAAIEGTETVTAATVDAVAADLFGDLGAGGHAVAVAQVIDYPAPIEADEPAAEPMPAVAERDDVEPVILAPADTVRPFRHSWIAPVESDPAPETIAKQAAEPIEEPVAAPTERVELAEDSYGSVPADEDAAPVEAAANEVDAGPAEAVPVPAEPQADVDARIAALEAKVEEQDAALRRVLTLMVDWMDDRAEPAAIAQPVEADPRGYVPIRGAAA